MKKKFIVILLIICCVIFTGCSLNKQTEELVSEKGYVEKETIDFIVAKYSNLIIEKSGLEAVKNDYLKIEDNKYWYKITDGIYLVVTPTTLKTPEEDIASSMNIYIEKDYIDDPQVIPYVRLLIMANNEEISFTEADNLVNEANKLVNQNLTANNGKGILVGYTKTSDYSEYQIIRNYQNN